MIVGVNPVFLGGLQIVFCIAEMNQVWSCGKILGVRSSKQSDILEISLDQDHVQKVWQVAINKFRVKIINILMKN